MSHMCIARARGPRATYRPNIDTLQHPTISSVNCGCTEDGREFGRISYVSPLAESFRLVRSCLASPAQSPHACPLTQSYWLSSSSKRRRNALKFATPTFVCCYPTSTYSAWALHCNCQWPILLSHASVGLQLPTIALSVSYIY